MSSTVKKVVQCVGNGVHSGEQMIMTLRPAPQGTGRVFRRVDLEGNPEILADVEQVVDTKFNTTLGNAHGVTVRTVEHLLAAVSACQITDLYMDLEGPEVPILDGSAACFIELLNEAGCSPLEKRERLPLSVSYPLTVETDYGAKITVEPSAKFSIEVTVDFKGRDGLPQSFYQTDDVYKDFAMNIARARTFGFFEDAEKMWAAGLAKGSSLENTVVFKEGGVLNDDGQRFENECARHKALDIVGDLALLNKPLAFHLTAYNPGHHLTYLLMKKLRDLGKF